MMRWWWQPKPTEAPAPALPAPSVWDSMDLDAKPHPAWPLIAASPIWTRELLPWFNGLLIQSLRALSEERDAETILALQVRIKLLEGLIHQPEIECDNIKRVLENRYQLGEDIERDSAYARR